MKTREVTCIGYLYILGGGDPIEYLLVREEQFTESVDGREGWTVIDPLSIHMMSGASDDMAYGASRFIVTHAPWYVDYHEQTVTVEDDTPTDDFEPTPSPDDPDWESIFEQEDKQNTIETPDPE